MKTKFSVEDLAPVVAEIQNAYNAPVVGDALMSDVVSEVPVLTVTGYGAIPPAGAAALPAAGAEVAVEQPTGDLSPTKFQAKDAIMEVADRIAQLQAEKAELSRLQAERSQLQAELLQVCTQQKELILTSMGKLAKMPGKFAQGRKLLRQIGELTADNSGKDEHALKAPATQQGGPGHQDPQFQAKPAKKTAKTTKHAKSGCQLQQLFQCPLTKALLVDPVIAADGHTYERSAMEQWIAAHNTSPVTGQLLTHARLVTNMAAKGAVAIQAMCEMNVGCQPQPGCVPEALSIPAHV
ncbi:hypothetical protein WJX79_006138 [Trebouxia sp. C0005]